VGSYTNTKKSEVNKTRLNNLLKLTFIFILVLSTYPLQFEKVQAQTQDLPTNLHLTWQNDTSTTITITWQTNSSTSGDIVLYDQTSKLGEESEYQYSATGDHFTYEGASGYIHNVELVNLTPDTIYYFMCGGPTGGYSKERSFRTSPSVSSDVRFVVGGDSRSNVKERENISVAMARVNPSLVLHVGDMIYDGRVQSQWDRWFTDLDSNWIGDNNLTIPIIPVLGNHEHPERPDNKYFVQFALPGNEKWFSLNWGPDIHIICLDNSYILDDISGPQRDWLENDLAIHAGYLWTFVVFHVPPFVTGPESAGEWFERRVREHWVPLFDKYHVDIVFSGHVHNYQRTHPINWTDSQTEPQDYSNGTMYIISGGWGAPLTALRPVSYMAYQNKTYHFCVVDVSKNGTLHLQAKDNLGNTIDEVTIYKTPAAFALSSLTVDPLSIEEGGTVTISCDVANTGGHTGSHTITLKIDGEVEDETTITLSPDETVTISFEVLTIQEGSYSVDVNGMSGNYTVTKPSIWDLIPGFPYEANILGLVAGAFILWLMQRRQ